MHISDPLPGNTRDAKAAHATGLSELLDENENAIANKGYIEPASLALYRKPPGGELIDSEKEFNTVINEIRYDRTLDLSLQGLAAHAHRLPQTKRTYATTFSAIRALHFFTRRFA